MNLKLLKYNITIALALSGIHYYQNPKSLEEHTLKVKKIGIEIVQEVKKPINAAKKKIFAKRKIASNSDNSDNSDNLKTSESDFNTPEQESEPKNTSNELNPFQKMKDDLKKYLKKSEEEKKRKNFSFIKENEQNSNIFEGNNNPSGLPTKKENENVKTDSISQSGISGSGLNSQNGPSGTSTNNSNGSSGSQSNSTPTPSPTPCTPPNSPVGLSVIIDNNKSKLSWPAETGVDSYSVYRGTTSENLSLLESNITETDYTDNFMTGGITYFYQISATNTCAESLTQSNEVSSSSLGSFMIISVVPSENQAVISWSTSAGALDYVLHYGTSSGVYSSSTTTSTPHTLSLTGGQTYYFKITSNNSVSSLDTAETSVYIPAAFTDNFNFNSSTSYNTGTDSEITGGVTKLIVSNLISEKTLNGTGNTYNNSLDYHTYIDSNLSLQNDLVQMNVGSEATYVSKVLDAQNSQVSINDLAFNTSIPFGKEIALSPETGYPLPVYDFSSDLISVWRFNESSFNNSADEIHDAKGIINGTTIGSVSSTTGKLDKALNFNGGANYIQIPDHANLDDLNNMTISTWVYPTLLNGQPRGIISKRVDSTAPNNAYSLFFYTGNKLAVDIVYSNNRFYSNKIFTVNNWYHIAVVFDGSQLSNNRVRLYINGELDTVASEASNKVPITASDLFFGSLNANYGTYYSGKIDETAIWSKSLSENQVKELYRRGANRVKFQLRTCDAISGNDCSGNTTGWVGPDGTFNSYFSELDNNTNPVTKLGTVGTTPFNSTLDKFTAGLTSWLATGTDATNRYIQYKAVLESDTTLFYPDFNKVSIGPLNRYPLSATVSSLNSAAVSFNSISKIEITQNCGDANSNSIDDDIRYAFSFSNDGMYYAFHSGAWTASSSFATANTKSELESLTAQDLSLIPSNTGSLAVVSYLSSTGLTDCQVDNIKITGSR